MKQILTSIKKRCQGSSPGFTLIEIMAAMIIFLIATVGVTGALTIGLRSILGARLDSLGRDAAREQIEELSARPFFVPYSTDPNVGTTGKVDLLDVYYPGLLSTSYTDEQNNLWSGSYTAPSDDADAYYTMHLPKDKNGVERTVVARFFNARFFNDSGQTVTPLSTYNAGSTGDDTPPSYLVKVTVTTSWTSQDGKQSYSLDKLISSSNQFGTGVVGTQPNSYHWSNSHVNLIGGLFVTETESGGFYPPIVNGSFGNASSRTNYNYGPYSTASATGGQEWIVNSDAFTGATASISGPPNDSLTAGPYTIAPAIWPQPYISGSSVEVHNKGSNSTDPEVEAESRAAVGTMSLQLQQLGNPPNASVPGFQQWYFINPAISVTGTGTSCAAGTPQVQGEIVQQNGVSTAQNVSMCYQQVNILPLQAYSGSTPSALQGLLFIGSFKASANASADGKSGGASSSLTYAATIGVFNPDKSAADCTGDACYDLYDVTPDNAQATMETILSNSHYVLQQALITELYGSTQTDISNALVKTSDGTLASVNVGASLDQMTNDLSGNALLRISMRYGTEVRRQIDGNQANLFNEQGLQRVWLGSFDVSVNQNQ